MYSLKTTTLIWWLICDWRLSTMTLKCAWVLIYDGVRHNSDIVERLHVISQQERRTGSVVVELTTKF